MRGLCSRMACVHTVASCRIQKATPADQRAVVLHRAAGPWVWETRTTVGLDKDLPRDVTYRIAVNMYGNKRGVELLPSSPSVSE